MSPRRWVLSAALLALGALVIMLLPGAAQAQTNQVYLYNYWRTDPVSGTADFTCTAQADPVGDPAREMPGPSIRGIVSDGPNVYVARLDGHVTAIEWATGKVVWDMDFVDRVPTGFTPFPIYTRAFKLIQDTNNLYVAMSDVESYDGRIGHEGILALSKADGSVVWDTRTAWDPFDLPEDVLSLAQDANYVYAGMFGGRIAKMSKATGAPVLDATERPLYFTGPPHPFGYKYGVWAIAVDGDRMWAALNYGGVPTWAIAKSRDNPASFDLLETSVNNRILILDTDTLTYYNGVERPLRLFDSDVTTNQNMMDRQSPRALPAIMSIWTSPNVNQVYVGGRGVTDKDDNRTFGVLFRFGKADNGSPNALGVRDLLTPLGGGNTPLGALVLRANRVTPPAAGEFVFEGRPLDGGIQEIMGDDQFLYVSSLTNMTGPDSGGPVKPYPVNRGANIFKIQLNTLTHDPSWDRSTSATAGAESFGRRVDAFHALSMYVEPGNNGRIFVGHNCDDAPTHPNLASDAAGADDAGFIRHKFGALIAELPKDGVRPSVRLMFPSGGDVTNGTYAVGFLTDLPVRGDNANPPRFNAELWVRDESVEGSPWRRIEGYKISNFVPNAYLRTNNVRLTWADATGRIVPLPEGREFRARIDIRDSNNVLVARDVADLVTMGRPDNNFRPIGAPGTFAIDRTTPILIDHSPKDGHVSTDGLFRLNITGRDSQSDISWFLSEVLIDGVLWPSGCLSFSYEFGQGYGYTTGYELDLGRAISQCPFAPRDVPLDDGYHIVRAILYDRSRNFAFVQFRILVDTQVRAPELTPLTNSWIAEKRPNMVADFFEDVTVKYAYLDGRDVRNLLLVADFDPVKQRKRILFKPDLDLSNGDHRLELWMLDPAGNLGGPFVHTVRVDLVPPVLKAQLPAPNSLITDGRPTISATYEDVGAGSGLRYETVQVRVDGFDVTDLATVESTSFRYDPLSALSAGPHTVEVTMRDSAGNVAKPSWTFGIDLERPVLELRVELPPGQTAVKKGDEVRLRVRADDDSGVRGVTIDVQGINPSYTGPVAAFPSLSDPNMWELSIRVNQTLTNPVKVQAFATDKGGQVNTADATVLVDNTPPVTFMNDVAPYVGAIFKLSWASDPPDVGSGVCYYILERRLDEDSDWVVVNNHIEDTEIEQGYAEAQQKLLRFRVFAVDCAGNRQSAASNTIETVARGDPFEAVFIPDKLVAGEPATFGATPTRGIDPSKGVVIIRLLGDKASAFEHVIHAQAQLYSGTWNLTRVPAGDYVLRFHYLGSDGIELVSKSHPVRVHPAALKENQPQEPSNDSPGLGALAVLGPALAVAVWTRRMGRGSGQ